MPLKLEALKKESEEIEFGSVKLKVPGQVPMELMIEFYDLREMDVKKITSEDLKGMVQLVKRILYLENDENKVNEFFAGLVPEHVTEVIIFVTNYIAAGKEGKKKDSEAG